MKRAQQGFTLIELMIVVAIIGILAAIAIPAFQKNVEKSKFAEALSMAQGYKTAVALCVNTLGVLAGCDANTNGIPALPAPMPTNVNAVGTSVANGVITITAVAAAGSYTSIMTPALDGGVIRWRQDGTCAGAAVKYC